MTIRARMVFVDSITWEMMKGSIRKVALSMLRNAGMYDNAAIASGIVEAARLRGRGVVWNDKMICVASKKMNGKNDWK